MKVEKFNIHLLIMDIFTIRKSLNELTKTEINKRALTFGLSPNLSLTDKKWIIASITHFIHILNTECKYNKNIIILPKGIILYRGSKPEDAEPMEKGDHWAVDGKDVKNAATKQGFESLFNQVACHYDIGTNIPKSHAQGFAAVQDGNVYSYKLIKPLHLVIICECLDILNKIINLVDTDSRRYYYCNAFEGILKHRRLDGFLNIDTGFVGEGDTLEAFICRPNVKLKLLKKEIISPVYI